MTQKPKSEKQGLDKKRYNRLAPFFDQFESPMELFNYSRWRAEFLKNPEEYGSEGEWIDKEVIS